MSTSWLTRCCTSALLLTASAALWPTACPAAAAAEPEWLTRPETAFGRAGDQGRPVLVFCHAPWCGWCQRMKNSVLTDPAVRKRLEAFVLLSVDVDEQTAFAARYAVRGVPQTLVLSARGQVLASRGGYVALDEFTAFLDQVIRSFAGAEAEDLQVKGLRKLLQKPALEEADWEQLHAALAAGEYRPLVLSGLLARAPFPARMLVRALDSPRLAVRLGALESLEDITGDTFGFDPWQPAAVRADSSKAWRSWAEKTETAGKVQRAYTALTPERVRQYLHDLVDADSARAGRARFMLASSGKAVLPVMDEFRRARTELTVAQALALKEVLWAVLAPDAWRGQALALAHGLARGNLDTRTDLVRRLGELPADQALPLLAELLRDEESLVREAAIKAIRLGGSEEGLKLLLAMTAERDPNVRVTLLHNLGESKSARAVPALLESLSGTEAEVVTAIQALGQCLGESSKPSQTSSAAERFKPLFADQRWRVRAALLETVTGVKMTALLPEVRKLLADPDPFVRKLAVQGAGRIGGKDAAVVAELFELFKADHSFKPVVCAAFASMSLKKLPDGFLAALQEAPAEAVVATTEYLAGLGEAGAGVLRSLAESPNDEIAAAALSKMRMSDYGRRGRVVDAAALAVAAKRAEPGGALEVRRNAVGALARLADETHQESARRPRDDSGVDLESLAVLAALFAKDPGQPVPERPQNKLEKTLAALLKDETLEIRLRAAVAMAGLGRGDGLAVLEASDEWMAPPLDREAAQVLARVPGSKALELLARIGARGSEKARSEAVEGLSSSPAPADVPRLFGLLRSKAVTATAFLEGLGSDFFQAVRRSKAFGTAVGDQLEALLDSTEPEFLQTGIVLAGHCGAGRFLPRLKRFLDAEKPDVRHLALLAINRVSQREGIAAAAARAKDDSAKVRLTCCRILASASLPDAVSRLRDELGEENVYVRSPSESGTPIRLDPVAEAALRDLYADGERSVRLWAGLVLLSTGRPFDCARLVTDLSAGAADWEREVIAALQARRAGVPSEIYPYLLSIRGPERGYLQEKVQRLIARIPKAERERYDALAAARNPGAGRLLDEPALPERGPGAAGRTRGQPAAAGRYALAFFSDARCRECARVRRELEQLKRDSFPTLEIQEYDIGQADAKDLHEVLSRRAGLPDRLHLVTPAVFTARGALVADDAKEMNRLVELIKAAEGLGAPWEQVSPEHLAEAHQAIVERVGAFPTLLVLSAGLLDGINPCAFTTILFFISYLTYVGRSRREILIVGVCFTAAMFVVYLAAGFGLLSAVQQFEFMPQVRRVAAWAIGGLAAVLGALSARDGVLCLRGREVDMALRLPGWLQARVHQVIRAGGKFRNIALAALATGAVVSVLEFGCTGQVYLPTIQAVVGQTGSNRPLAVAYLVAYNLMFILPLVVVFLLAYFGVASARLTSFFRKHLAGVKFATALLFIVLGGYVILQAIY